jgi:hypothetical protein
MTLLRLLKHLGCYRLTSQSQARKRMQKERRASTRNHVRSWWEAVNGSYIAILQV